MDLVFMLSLIWGSQRSQWWKYILMQISVVRVDTKDCFLCIVLENTLVSLVNDESES